MNSGPTLQQGSTGPDVRRAQRILVMLKFLDPSGIDGVYGTKTRNAVREFQQSKGLAVDGIVGPGTWGAMPANPKTKELHPGSSGAVVTALQKGLRKFRGAGAPTDPGPPDGSFGPNTEKAVRAYQSDRGVGVDGIVGDRTWWAPAGAAGATLASLSELTTD